MSERLRMLLWAAWWAMAAAGVGISLVPGPMAASLGSGMPASHLWPFGVLMLTGMVAARPWQVWRVAAGTAVIAVGIELAQLVVPGRAFELRDLRDDAVGMATGWAVARVCQAVWRRMEPEATSVLVVVHAYRENRYGKEIIRIIAARRAEKHEIRRYQDPPLE